MKHKLLTLFTAVSLFVASVVTLGAPTPVNALGPQQQQGPIIYRSLNVPHNVRTWRIAAKYNLKTMVPVGHYGAGSVIRVSQLAYRGGMFFYLEAEAFKEGRFEGVIINTVYRINDRGQAIVNGHVLPIRNGMPLSQHRTQQGTCTASRLWYEGMNNNMVAAIQRIELHSGKPMPINYAFRTNAEQRCIYNNRGSNSYPVAVPGTSDHEKGLAVDVDSAYASNPSYERLYNQYGLCRPIPASDPIHYEYCR